MPILWGELAAVPGVLEHVAHRLGPRSGGVVEGFAQVWVIGGGLHESEHLPTLHPAHFRSPLTPNGYEW